MSDLDPVLRCESCQTLVRLETLHKHGCCVRCGNKRVRNVNTFNAEEHAQMRAWGLDEFLAEFEATSDV